MARRKRPAAGETEHDPDQDVYILQEEGDEPESDDDATIIETQVVMDWIEYNIDEDDEEETSPVKPGTCRLTFHVDLPEHIAQHLFAHHVKDGQLTVEFQPTSPALRRRDAIVRS